MIRAWISLGAVIGFLSVSAGAVAAHFAAAEPRAELLRTGAVYGMVHAAALIGVAAMAAGLARPGRALITAGWSFAAGGLMFSFSLFALAQTGIEWFGLVTPFGGVGLLIGWAAIGLHALSSRH